MQVRLMRLMLKMEYLIVPKGTKFTGLGKLVLIFQRLNTERQNISNFYNCTYADLQKVIPSPRRHIILYKLKKQTNKKQQQYNVVFHKFITECIRGLILLNK